MDEIVFSAPDADFLASEAARLGFMDDAGNIIIDGTLATGGSWFLNIVGTILDENGNPRDGYWGRVRINGTPDQMPDFSPLIIRYVWSDTLLGWTVDGATLAPTWIGSIGVMA